MKLNDGFSGEGNAVFKYDGLDPALSEAELTRKIYDLLPERLKFEAPNEVWDTFLEKYVDMQGIVEAWVDGDIKNSPSVQCRVNALGEPQVISTHDQVLGGATGQIFLGCTFPAIDDYRLEIQEAGALVAQELANRGVMGRFGIDFVPSDGQQLQVNLRKGGTTHPSCR